MSSKSKSSNVSHLLAAIQRKTSLSPAPAPSIVDAVENSPINPKSTRKEEPRSRVGKPVQFWLHDEDRKIVRELAAWLAGQGLRPTDSMVIKAALRMSKTGGELLEAYQQAAQLDGRLKQPHSSETM